MQFLILLFYSTDDTKQIPIIPGLSSGVGKMIYAGSIGTQIASELIDSYRYIVFLYMYKIIKVNKTSCIPLFHFYLIGGQIETRPGLNNAYK